jgi:hypothetical protein
MEYTKIARDMSPAELLDFSNKHLGYEIDMFFRSGKLLSETDFSETDDTAVTLRNALVESFATHLRNLVYFLYPKQTDLDEVISNWFFNNDDAVKNWQSKRGSITTKLKTARRQANGWISHLTTSRVTNNNWLVPELMQEMRDILKIFADNASDAKLDVSVKKLINNDSVSRSDFRLLDATGTSMVSVRINLATVPTSTNQPIYVSSTIPGSRSLTNKP